MKDQRTCNQQTSRVAVFVATLGLLFTAAYAQAQGHTHTCACASCSLTSNASGGGEAVSNIQFFGSPSARWSSTATDGFNGTGDRGDAITLTYGVVPDGTTIAGTAVTGEDASDASNLINFLDTNIGSGVWEPLIDDAYQRWGEVSGLTMIRENADDGLQMGNPGFSGVIGTRADMRIGGRSLDGQGNPNTLAYNYSPSSGDHVVDTDNVSFYSNPANSYRAFCNVFIHESGHGLGLAHTIPINGTKLMKPFINTGFDGPQFDDILAV